MRDWSRPSGNATPRKAIKGAVRLGSVPASASPALFPLPPPGPSEITAFLPWLTRDQLATVIEDLVEHRADERLAARILGAWAFGDLTTMRSCPAWVAGVSRGQLPAPRLVRAQPSRPARQSSSAGCAGGPERARPAGGPSRLCGPPERRPWAAREGDYQRHWLRSAAHHSRRIRAGPDRSSQGGGGRPARPPAGAEQYPPIIAFSPARPIARQGSRRWTVSSRNSRGSKDVTRRRSCDPTKPRPICRRSAVACFSPANSDAGEGSAALLTWVERKESSRARKDLGELRRENDLLKKDYLICESGPVKYAAIAMQVTTFSVQWMCKKQGIYPRVLCLAIAPRSGTKEKKQRNDCACKGCFLCEPRHLR